MNKKIVVCTLLSLVGLVLAGLGLAMYFNDRSHYVVELESMNEQYERCQELERGGADPRTIKNAYRAFELDADQVRDSRKSMRESWLLTGPGLVMFCLGAMIIFKSHQK